MPQKKWISLSAVLHLTVICAVIMTEFPTITSSIPAMTTRLSAPLGEMATIGENEPVAQLQPLPEAPRTMEPVEYAGAPPMIEDEREPDNSEIGAAPTPTPTPTPDDFRHHLKRAVTLHRKGVRIPDYIATALSDRVVWTIVTAGLGHVVASRSPFGTDLVAVKWGADGPANYTRLQPGTWPAGVSTRAVELPPALTRKVTQGVRDSLGMRAQGLKVYLVVSTTLDQFILAEQLRAVEQLHLELDAVARTSGQFLLGETGITGFSVHVVTLIDGRTLSLATAG